MINTYFLMTSKHFEHCILHLIDFIESRNINIELCFKENMLEEKIGLLYCIFIIV